MENPKIDPKIEKMLQDMLLKNFIVKGQEDESKSQAVKAFFDVFQRHGIGTAKALVILIELAAVLGGGKPSE